MMMCLLLALRASAAPQVSHVDPPPGTWIVDGRDTLSVTLSFDSEVVVPDGGIHVYAPFEGRLGGVIVSPVGSASSEVVVTVDALNERVLRIVADVSVVDADGVALDGDHDGAAGGSAIFEYVVSTGDVTRDGTVDGDDLDAFVAALDTQDPSADLDDNGVVDEGDRDIILEGFGGAVAFPDGVAPVVTNVAAEFFGDRPPVIRVTFDEPMDPASIHRYSAYGLFNDEMLLVASGPPTTADNLTFAFPFADLTCDRDVSVRVDRSSADAGGETLAAGTTRVVTARDQDAPDLTCPEPLYVNSTTVSNIPAADVSGNEAIQAYLASAQAIDVCTPAEQFVWTTTLDEPHDLPLGVNEVTFTVTDEAGNSASCQALIIVVPAVPLEGQPGIPGQDGADGAPGEDGADGTDGDDGRDGMAGEDGDEGQPGISCWDLNENGEPDPEEDVNGDDRVDVLDCRALLPDEDAPGQPVPDGTADCGGFCGAFGMLNLLWMFAGLQALRLRGRWQRRS